MKQPTVQFRGTEVVVKNCRRVSAKVAMAVQVASKRAGYKIANEAKGMCPVDTGRLRASLTVNWTGSGMARPPVKQGSEDPKNPSQLDDTVGKPEGMPGFHVAVGTNVEYSEDVEDRSPYLWPAFAMHKEEFKGELAILLRGAIIVG